MSCYTIIINFLICVISRTFLFNAFRLYSSSFGYEDAELAIHYFSSCLLSQKDAPNLLSTF
jgi:hypothetical protein